MEDRGAQVVQAGEVRLARLESARAVAALAVLAGHVWGGLHGYGLGAYGSFWRRLLLSGGLGVFVFFALSGFLLFSPFVRRAFGTGERTDLRAYARNRALRILPLYYVAVVVLMVLSQDGGTPTLWWRHLLFVQSLWADSLNAVDGPLWSVAVEIQFYALLPFLALALARAARGSLAVAAALLLALGALSALARIVLVVHAGDPGTWSYQLPTTFAFFVAGMSLALLRHALGERTAPLPGPLGSSTAWVLASVPLWLLVAWRLDYDLLCVPASFLVVGALVLPLRGGLYVRALEWRPLALLGIASYSLYVWHKPILDWLDAGRGLPAGFAVALVCMTALAIAVAVVSYRVIETPALRLRRQWSRSAAPQVEAGR